MKKVFEEYRIPTASFVVMGAFDRQKIKHLEYPLIVKPVDCNSSKGVKRVENEEELIPAFETAVALSRTKTAIVEEYMEGEELSADIYIENGVAHLLSISSLDKIANSDKFVIFRGFYSKEKTERVRALVETIAQQIADAFHLENSPMLIQMIYDGQKARVLEFSARTGGGVKYLLIQKASGFDVISAVVDLTLGKKPTFLKQSSQNNYIANEFIYCKPGDFDRLDGFDEAKEKGYISDYYLFKWRGAEFSRIENSGDRIGGFTVQADSMEELKRKHCVAVAMMRVLDSNGNDMMRRDLLEQI